MRKKIGKLDCLIRPGSDNARAVVLSHGFGADAADLFSLADFLDPDEQWNFYFPDAPLVVPIGPMMSGRAWFPISVRELEEGLNFVKLRPPGMNESSALVYDLCFQLNAERLVLGGFSQGAMLATEVALDNPGDVAGLVLLSGALLDQENWKRKASGLSGKTFIQSHGTGDPVIPFAAAQGLYDVLKAGGVDGQLLSFNGGHEIPVPVLVKVKEYLARVLD